MEGGGNIQEANSTVENQDQDEESQNRGCYYSCYDPRGTCHRFIALFFMCFLGFGSYFCYDNPAALKSEFEKDLGLSDTKFNLLYSLYSWPNVVLCFVGGYLIDRVFGIRLGTNIFMLITLMGQLLFAAGAFFNTFWIMAAGRFLFGIGGESLAVAQNSYAVLWFKGKELNMVFGLQLSLARIGSTVNFWVVKPIYDFVDDYYLGFQCLGIVLFISTGTCLISMVCSMILGCLDKRADRILRRNEHSTGEVVKLSVVTEFPITFWLLSVVCVAYYVAIFPFIANGQGFFKEKWPEVDANTVNSIIYLISAFASPILGFLVDKTGRNVLYVFISILATIASHSLLTFSTLNPYIGMSFMGLSYSLLASGLWPLVALIIPEHQLGTAYGICQAVQNLGLAVISILIGYIVDTYGYWWMEIFFCSCLTVSLLAIIAVWLVDSSRGGLLNMSPSKREQHQQELLAASILESEKLLAAGVSNSMEESNDFLQTNSDFHIRNRYLSRIGATLHDNQTYTY
ncbi:PREDICTED: major facilitator superfamily domain-containing protein 1-like [Nicrophorus vespilloides]|uniref:Lysosomal dipeptide transporter MFSD1 n=1 Tax=Nicrophorus vespilloides TaxID=110193 RepID=A0ABM1M605_NICVS|nr:PREDICTED: major facilitator superfamily domain-containing protein 1-like [Nicrophorus vespilloides]